MAESENSKVIELKASSPIARLRSNAQAATSMLISRMQLAFRAGLSFGGKRDTYKVFGYDRLLDYNKYYARYQRNGIAYRVINCWAEATWRKPPVLWDVNADSTKRTSEFEIAWDALNKKFHVFSVFERMDRLQRLGEYAVLMIGAAGAANQPIKTLGSLDKLLYLTPYGQGGAMISTLQTDTANPRFGLPAEYKIGGVDLTHLNLSMPMPKVATPTHYSRILHVAEGILEGMLFGIPALQPVWNYLDDLDKITGGSAETFWQTGNRGMAFKLDPTFQFDNPTDLAAEIEEYTHEMKRTMVLQGVEPQELGVQVADGSGPFMVAVKCISGATGIPMRILLGSEAGQLASTQDRDNWNERVVERRSAIAEPVFINPFVEMMVALGVLPEPKGGIVNTTWPDLIAFSADQKSQQALRESVAMSNYANAKSKGFPIATVGELRQRWFGWASDMPSETNELPGDGQFNKSAQSPGEITPPTPFADVPVPNDPAKAAT